jgi:hypothetical protein
VDERVRIKQEVAAVEWLGNSIGYGHLMALATALWRRKLKSEGLPEHGAFIGVCDISIKKDRIKSVMEEVHMYDEIIKKYYVEVE